MRRTLTMLMMAVVAAFAVSARTVTVETTTAGTLQTLVGTSTDDVTELNVSGPINAADMEFVATKLTAIDVLNLEGATIEPYYGAGHTINGYMRYDGNMIPPMIFAGISATQVVLPVADGLAIGEGAFAGAAVKQVTVPSGVTKVGEGAFAGCRDLTTAEVRCADCLGTDVFANCTSLTSATINSLTKIPSRMFDNCSALSDLKYSAANITAIEDAAFRGCKLLTSFDFGAKITYIGASSFAESGLQSADLEPLQQLTAIGEYAFAGCAALTGARLGAGIEDIGAGVLLNCGSLNELKLSDDILAYPDAMLANTALSGKFELPEGVMSMGDYMFANVSGISEFRMPESLIYVGDGAMSGMTGLERIFADTLTHVPQIGAEVWYGVEQPDVKLLVSKDMFDTFSASEQWKEFDVTMVSGTDDIAAEAVAVKVKARFEGTDIHIIADGADIRHIDLYDAAGSLLTAGNIDAAGAVIPTSSYSTRLYVANVILVSGERVAVKLVRP